MKPTNNNKKWTPDELQRLRTAMLTANNKEEGLRKAQQKLSGLRSENAIYLKARRLGLLKLNYNQPTTHPSNNQPKHNTNYLSSDYIEVNIDTQQLFRNLGVTASSVATIFLFIAAAFYVVQQQYLHGAMHVLASLLTLLFRQLFKEA